MSRTIPTQWTTIAFYSPTEGKMIPLPNAVCTEEQAAASAFVQTQTIRRGKREILQVRRGR